MEEELKKKIAKEYLRDMLTGDDEMLSVHLMRKFKITPEEFVQVTNWIDKQLELILA